VNNIAFIAASVCLAAWLYLLLLHGRFWDVRRSLLALHRKSPIHTGLAAAVIPARNEAENIGRGVRSLLDQSCGASIRIFVVDDSSFDGTADAARAVARTDEERAKLTVLAGLPLPPHWTGKLWAMQRGIGEALKLDPQCLLLTDADIEHAPHNIATLVSIAEAGNYDLVSFMVRLHCRSFAEKLLIPAFVFFFFMLYPPAWISSSRRRTAGAAGGCMLVRPAALERSGGIEAIRGEIIDDCALARRVKDSGGRVWLGLTRDTSSLREYKTFAEIERMIARTAFNQLHHSSLMLLGAIVGLALVFLLPLALLISGHMALTILGLAAYGLMSLAYLPTVRFYDLSPAYCLTLPFAALFYMAATVHSAFKYWTGRGGEWKGRAQDIGK
jgi:hopene-associated glycosyltransferase HpnB